MPNCVAGYFFAEHLLYFCAVLLYSTSDKFWNLVRNPTSNFIYYLIVFINNFRPLLYSIRWLRWSQCDVLEWYWMLLRVSENLKKTHLYNWICQPWRVLWCAECSIIDCKIQQALQLRGVTDKVQKLIDAKEVFIDDHDNYLMSIIYE